MGWYLTDAEGSVRAIVDTSGTILDELSYGPYGELTIETSATAGDRFKYAGGAYDSATGLEEFGNRYYYASMGRWISQDPTGFGGGDANLSRYAGNDPMNLVDPSGLRPAIARQSTDGTWYTGYANQDGGSPSGDAANWLAQQRAATIAQNFASHDALIAANNARVLAQDPNISDPANDWSPGWVFAGNAAYNLTMGPLVGVYNLFSGKTGAALAERALQAADRQVGYDPQNGYLNFGVILIGMATDLTGIRPIAEGITGRDFGTGQEYADLERGAMAAGGVASLLFGGLSLSVTGRAAMSNMIVQPALSVASRVVGPQITAQMGAILRTPLGLRTSRRFRWDGPRIQTGMGQTGLRDMQLVNQIKKDMLNGQYRFTADEGRIGGWRDAAGNYYIGEGHHRMNAALQIFEETGETSYVNQLLENGAWTPGSPSAAQIGPLPRH